MLRKGFTLLEILLTLAIIGALAAVLLKVITNAMPDAGKAKFLKAYSTTRLIVSEMINDSSLYPDTDEASEMYGFANTTQPFYGFYNDPEFSGDQKFEKIFADRLSLKPNGAWYESRREGTAYSFAKGKCDDKPAYIVTIIPRGDENNDLGKICVFNDGDVKCDEFRGEDCDVKALMDLRQGAGEDED